MILKVEGLKKTYVERFGLNRVEALKNISFEVEAGEFIAIMGESGSGKTTLLNVLAGLDDATEGRVLIDNTDISKIKEGERADYRRKNLGFVFQEFNLLDTLNITDNIFLPLVLSGYKYNEMKSKLDNLVGLLGIEEIIKKYPYEISGGQKQRVAIARALITEPKLILADEPTGALDSKASDKLMGIFESLNKLGNTILMVTHSPKAASSANRVLFIKDGEIFHQLYRGNKSSEELFEQISTSLSVIYSRG